VIEAAPQTPVQEHFIPWILTPLFKRLSRRFFSIKQTFELDIATTSEYWVINSSQHFRY